MFALAELELQAFVAQPGYADVRVLEAGADQQRIVCSLLKLHRQRAFIQDQRGGGVDEVAEQMSRLDRLIAVPNPLGEMAARA